jgi:glyoxylase-like metal-dependent hydrolase (beta-lactamase superfamily II)
MRLTNGVTMLEIPTLIMGSPGIIYPTLIMDKENVILVDAGLPGQITQLRQAFEKEGVAFYRLTKVILTHHDIDPGCDQEYKLL